MCLYRLWSQCVQEVQLPICTQPTSQLDWAVGVQGSKQQVGSRMSNSDYVVSNVSKPAPETNQGGVQVSYVSINVLRDQRSVDCVLSEVKLCIDVVQKTATALFLVYRGSDQFGSDIKLLGP